MILSFWALWQLLAIGFALLFAVATYRRQTWVLAIMSVCRTQPPPLDLFAFTSVFVTGVYLASGSITAACYIAFALTP